MISHDPKHGRWILPLIIAAMVVLTITFVTRLEPAENPAGSAGPDEPAFTTAPTSSTTTLPTEIAAFMVTLDIFENQLETFAADAEQINAQWESREVQFSPTRDAFLALQSALRQWEDGVAQVDGVPADLAEAHVDLVIEVGDLPSKVDDIITGLEAPDDGTLRRQAVAEFAAEVQQVADAIQAIRDLAMSPPTTTETTIGS